MASRGLGRLGAVAAVAALLFAGIVVAGRAEARMGVMYGFHVGDDFLGGLDPSFAPAVARADNGDTIEIRGNGMFDTGTKAASGSGTVVHKDASGTVVGTGDWVAVALLSFKSYGNDPENLPAAFEGGWALIRIEITPTGSTDVFTATLTLLCAIGKVPGDRHESSTLNVLGFINFNKGVSGANLFVRMG